MSKIIPHRNNKLHIEVKSLMTAKLEAIAERDGVDPSSLVVLQVAGFIDREWDWKRCRPKEKMNVNQ